MRRYIPTPATLYTFLLMIGLVRAHPRWGRPLVQRGMLIELLELHPGLRFGNGIMNRELGAHAVAILHPHMAVKAADQGKIASEARCEGGVWVVRTGCVDDGRPRLRNGAGRGLLQHKLVCQVAHCLTEECYPVRGWFEGFVASR
jgi:hypothetical protein